MMIQYRAAYPPKDCDVTFWLWEMGCKGWEKIYLDGEQYIFRKEIPIYVEENIGGVLG